MKPGSSDQIEFPNHSGLGVKKEEHDECKTPVGAFYSEGFIIAQPGGDGSDDT